MKTIRLEGLVAAVHTPFADDGELDLSAVERQAEFLQGRGIRTVFVGGSTGESHSLTLVERLSLSKAWRDALAGAETRLVVHVGSNCLADARTLAAHAEEMGAAAVAALAPSYFKPATLETLVDCCREIAAAAPSIPFYFYDIPALTAVHFSMPDFLEVGSKSIPNLGGIKFTNSDLMAFQRCLATQGGRFDIPWGVDETMLAALALGAKGAVGSSFNFAAPLYHRLIRAFESGDLESARTEQLRSVQLIGLLASYGYMAAAKATMGFLGVKVGPPRLPNSRIDATREAQLRSDLEKIGFFDWGSQ